MVEDTGTGRPEGEAGDPLDAIIAEAVGGPQTEAPETVQEVPAEQVAETDFDLPQHWADEEKAKWKAVAPDQRALLLDVRKSLEKGYQEKFKTIADKKRHWKELKEIFAPLQDHLKMNGATKLQAVKQLVGAQMALMNRPDQALPWLAQQYAGSLPPDAKSAILQGLQRAWGVGGTAAKPNPSDDYLDPRAAQEIAALKQYVSQLGGHIQQSALAQQQAAVASAEKVIEDFTTAKDASGSPAHPYFEEVRPEVERLLAVFDRNGRPFITGGSPAERLKKAYDMAIRSTPEVWERIDLDRKQAKAKAEAEKRRAEVAAAKPAARNVQGQSVPAPTKSKKFTLDDALNEALSEARA